MGNSCWKFILTTFVLSRLFFFGVGIVAAAFLPWLEGQGKVPEALDFLEPWTHWDGKIYLDLATHGYVANGPDRTAFFPVFPMFIHLGAALGFPITLWGVL